MKIKPLGLAIMTIIIIFGGILLAQLLGLWNTKGGQGQGKGHNSKTVASSDYTYTLSEHGEADH